ncbi:urease accessory protein D isoform X2 [Momordica charantia]|uniref:Urease accessory protein D isoform X2 n=1 Tax=Momordica charantia TaxID=3673 RepID=A0A6J1D097_MOMCH|nr:urease accessory protein D isoform X2 [Momordica charantia]
MEVDGAVVIEKVAGKSAVTRCFSKYPLKFIIPRKGDSISCELTVKDGCTAILTTQSSTKVYKSRGEERSEQVLKATIGRDALLAVLPDPVTCFATARYAQKQVFRADAGSSMVLVDWFTSGRHGRGEIWEFDFFKSTNQIYLEDDHPLFFDTVLLERESTNSLIDRMHGYQVIAMVVILGPKVKNIRDQVRENVKKMMSDQLHSPFTSARGAQMKMKSDHFLTKPGIIASSSVFGPMGIGTVVRIAAMETETVYRFLQQQLASMEPLLGVPPYK